MSPTSHTSQSIEPRSPQSELYRLEVKYPKFESLNLLCNSETHQKWHLYWCARTPSYTSRIYLAEKNFAPSVITKVPPLSTLLSHIIDYSRIPLTPAGGITVLAISDLSMLMVHKPYIGQSLAILKHLKNLADDATSGFKASTSSMRGNTPLGRARMHEILSLADECLSSLGYWCAFGCSSFPKAIPEAAQIVRKYPRVRLRKIDECLADRDLRFLDSESGGEGSMQSVTVADCVLFSLLE